ncbi:hypothetical protein HKCCE2091_13830 [Rhodobacterales bacterium HKCCE2091]|nr:hypothetical protein [Rhodobacterales bacterium HKCCE2091]
MFSVRLIAGAAVGLAAFTSSAVAQNANRPVCAARDVIVGALSSRYGETAQSLGLGPGNRVVELFASEETGTWTITVTSVNGTTCLVASGDNYTVLAQGPEGEPL